MYITTSLHGYRRRLVAGLVVLAAAGACASDVERSTKRELAEVERRLAPLPADDAAGRAAPRPEAVGLDGSLERYLVYAFEHSPELRASFEDWRAATHRPRQMRRLPEPTITYAGFIRSVETRVGPQRHKLGVMQWFPWPSKLGAGGKAEALAAQSAQRRFEAHALVVSAEVSRAYWRLWLVARTREVRRDERVVLAGLSEQIRVRVEASMADLADLAQVNLRLARLEDEIAGLDEQERATSAELVRAIGAPPGTPTPVATAAPEVAVPEQAIDELHASATDHPRVEAMAVMSDATDQHRRRARADRFPSFGVGVDWIITGDAPDPSMADSGKDPVIAMVAVKVPLWGRAYGAAEREARARGRAFRARELAARNRAAAELEQALVRTRDSGRRARLHESTLIPQAETTYGSVQSSYHGGRATIGEVLLAERELLELQLGLARARAEHAIAWAELERVVGRPVAAKGADR